MADNYLERRMEDYRRGVQSRPRQTSRAPRCSSLKILAAATPDETLAAILAPLVQGGHRVAITAPRSSAATETAQRCGARLFPDDYSLAEILDCYEGSTDALLIYRHTDPAGIARRWLDARRILPEQPRHGRIVLMESPAADLADLAEAAAEAGVTVNEIVAGKASAKVLADTLRWILSPLSDHISAHSFRPDLAY